MSRQTNEKQIIRKLENYEEPDLIDYNLLKSCSEVHEELTRSQFPDFFQRFRYLAQKPVFFLEFYKLCLDLRVLDVPMTQAFHHA